MKRALLACIAIAALSSLVGASGNKETSKAPQAMTTITFLSGKPEISAQIEEMARVFSEANPGIRLEIVQGQANTSPFQTMTVMYNAGNAASVFMIEQGDIPKLTDKLADLTSERWVKDAVPSALPNATFGGAVLAAPFATECVGIIYNRAVIEKAIGGKFDPNTVKTTRDLESVFQKVEASGVTAAAISPENWSLGAHWMMEMYGNQSPNNAEKNTAFTEDLRKGTVDLAKNRVFNGWLDTFDLFRKYNINKDDPLAANNDKNAAYIVSGKVAFWFMGNFFWPPMAALNANPSDFGIMPVPVSNNAADDANTRLLALFSMYLAVDKAQNSPQQQAAAKKLITWLLYDPVGQDQMVNKMGIVPAYTHVKLPPQDPLGQSLASYISAGRTLDFSILYPSDHWQVLGASFQKYLGGQTDRAGFAKEIQEYWKTAK
jgi:raffinose/stachyose/melibiose transport system substrate-binding protein